MLRIIAAALYDKRVVLVADGEDFYQVRFVWPWDEKAPEKGAQCVYPYEATEHATSEAMAYKWGDWDPALTYDDNEIPPPPKLLTAVNRAFEDYKAGRGYTP